MGKECSLGYGSSWEYWVKEEGMMSQWSTLSSGKKSASFPRILARERWKEKGELPTQILLAYAWYSISMPKGWVTTFSIRNVAVINFDDSRKKERNI